MNSLALSGSNTVQNFTPRCYSAAKYTKSYTYAEQAADFSFTPGIGSYNVARSFSACSYRQPVYTMKSRHPQNFKSTNVGPGSYNPKSVLDLHGSYMAKGRRMQSTDHTNTPNVVGPGSYRPESAREGVNKYKGFSLSGRIRIPSSSDAIPGVGSYNIDRRDSRRPITMEGRHQHFGNMYDITFNNPGVGAYSIDVENKERFSHGYTFPHNFEKLKVNSTTPGVGSYNIATKNQHRYCSFGGRYKGNHF